MNQGTGGPAGTIAGKIDHHVSDGSRPLGNEQLDRFIDTRRRDAVEKNDRDDFIRRQGILRGMIGKYAKDAVFTEMRQFADQMMQVFKGNRQMESIHDEGGDTAAEAGGIMTRHQRK